MRFRLPYCPSTVPSVFGILFAARGWCGNAWVSPLTATSMAGDDGCRRTDSADRVAASHLDNAGTAGADGYDEILSELSRPGFPPPWSVEELDAP